MTSFVKPASVIHVMATTTLESAIQATRGNVISALDDGLRTVILNAQAIQPEELRAIEAQLASVIKERDVAKAHITDVNADLAKRQAELKHANDAVEQLQKQIALQERLSAADIDTQRRLAEVHKSNDEHVKHKCALEMVHATIKERLDQSQRELQVRTSNLTAAEIKLHQSQETIRQLELKIATLESRIATEKVDIDPKERQRQEARIAELQYQSFEQKLAAAANRFKEAESKLIHNKELLEKELTAALENEKRAVADAIKSSEAKIESVKRESTDALKAAEAKVESSKRESTDAIKTAEATVASVKRESALAVDNARLASAEQIRSTTQLLIDKANRAESELQSKKVIIDLMEKQMEELKRHGAKLQPADLGTAGELEIEQVLQRTFGSFMVVRNVSKVGQGHEMDLELCNRDNTVRIRIDVKNSKAALLPEDEITRFYRDVDSLNPSATGAILFMRPALRPLPNFPEANIHRSRRGNTMVFQIGWWAVSLLVETILEIVANHRADVLAAAHALKPFVGSGEVNKAVGGLCDLVAFQNQLASRAGLAIAEWTTMGAEKNRVVAEQLRTAHTANPNAVSKDVLVEFEKTVPKRRRGRPPAVDEKDSKHSIFAPKNKQPASKRPAPEAPSSSDSDDDKPKSKRKKNKEPKLKPKSKS